MTPDPRPGVAKTSKDILRKFIPNFLLQQRGIVRRLGPGAGRVYASLRLLDMLGIRIANQRMAPRSARFFLFICFGNIMRSAMAEFVMRQTLRYAGLEDQVRDRIRGPACFAGSRGALMGAASRRGSWYFAGRSPRQTGDPGDRGSGRLHLCHGLSEQGRIAHALSGSAREDSNAERVCGRPRSIP